MGKGADGFTTYIRNAVNEIIDRKLGRYKNEYGRVNRDGSITLDELPDFNFTRSEYITLNNLSLSSGDRVFCGKDPSGNLVIIGRL
ncbi:hypothetical protein DH09_08175 [Bacillaceae bacterium JMAK1]|nr:hypothetical protein DH09_08175 [Bacillaceae bacterium JMAK1]